MKLLYGKATQNSKGKIGMDESLMITPRRKAGVFAEKTIFLVIKN
jgi:hypothetical protein